MKHKINLVVLCCFLSVTLMSCLNRVDNQASDIEKNFLLTVPVADMNKTLQLSVDGDQKVFRFGSEIDLTIHNMSKYSVMFDTSSSPKLFIIRNGEWVEVNNEITYSGATVMSPKGTILLDQNRTIVKPVLDKTILNTNEQEVSLRVVVICEILENDVRTGKLVGAYVDVILKPGSDIEL